MKIDNAPTIRLLRSIASEIVGNYLVRLLPNSDIPLGHKVVGNSMVIRESIKLDRSGEYVKQTQQIRLHELAPLIIDGQYVTIAKPRNLAGSRKHTHGIVVDMCGFYITLFMRKDNHIRVLLTRDDRKSMVDFERMNISQLLAESPAIQYRKLKSV